MAKTGLFRKKKAPDEDIDVFDPDEEYDLMLESALYVEAQPLKDTSSTFYPRDIYRLDTDALLESVEELPYEFRCYLDTRRAFAKAFELCREDITGYASFEGGKSAWEQRTFKYDGRCVTLTVTLSRESERAPYTLTAEINFE
ncbi:MAG: hypothetical protein IJT87_02810 [Ruminiclostridium sp.]|nr:hypothetical protein [Ruminiclostridium sp.]